MPPALVSLLIAFFLSLSSLLIVLMRVSPLLSPEFALPFFFASVLGAVSSLLTLLLALTKSLGSHPFLSRAVLRSSLRQGILLGSATCVVLFLFLLRIHSIWIALLVYAAFILIEMAVGR